MLQARRRLLALADHVLDSMQDVPSSIQWSKELKGGLLPTGPAENVALTVKSGAMPEDLAGVYMRVGPNPYYWPPRKRTHVFDGDGMVHSVRICNGSATYNCAYMETPRLQFEKEWGQEWFPRIGEFNGKAGLAKILTVLNFKGKLAGLQDYESSVANTAIGFTPDGKLWALNEGGAPFRFRLDDIGVPHSVGFDTLMDTHEKPISAHPKFDQRTGETFFHGRKIMESFYMGRAVDGKVTDFAPIKMPTGFHHDMFITENYAVLVDGACRFDPKGVVQGKPLWNFMPKNKLRFGVYPRSSEKMTEDAIIWIEADVSAEIVHTLYAFDEDGKITLWSPIAYYDGSKQEGILGGMGPFRMHRLVIDVSSRSVQCDIIPGGEELTTEFPRIREDRMGLRVSSGFSGLQGDGPDFNFIGICKWDFSKEKLASVIRFPEGVVGGEPVFLPRGGAYSSSSFDDDGYVGMFLWNQATEESTFALFDAHTFSAEPVVELAVPRRVPLGFHAAYITEEQFQQQLKVA